MCDWKDVEKDGLPKIKARVLYSCIVAKENGVVLEAMFNTETREFVKDLFNTKLNHKVTHWMPLPDHPTIKNIYDLERK